jgi:hypothetical protein
LTRLKALWLHRSPNVFESSSKPLAHHPIVKTPQGANVMSPGRRSVIAACGMLLALAIHAALTPASAQQNDLNFHQLDTLRAGDKTKGHS